MPPSQEPAAHRYALPSGHRIGDYRIEGFLGAGSFGITYLATDERLGRRVAVKEYLPSDWAIRDTDGSVAAKTQSDAEDLRWGLDRFADEARSLARFDHPNVVRVHRYFTARATGFLVMEYVDGGSLGDLLRRKGTLSEAEIDLHVLPVLDGLEQLHNAGLLHRDIKPDNIALRADGSPVLVDFGAARQEVGARSRALTSLVTPRYSPLEQYSINAKQGPATDLYAFAAVLYRCVTGSTPLDAADRSLGEEQMPASEAAKKGGYGVGLLVAIDAALSPGMQERPGDVPQFRGMLGCSVSGDGEPAKDGSDAEDIPRTPSSLRRSTTPVLAVALLGALAAIHIWLLLFGSPFTVADRTEPTNHLAALEGAMPQPGGTFLHKLSSGGEGPEMVVVPAGSFRYQYGVWPAREVSIPFPFALSVYEVTFEDYDRFAHHQRVSDEGWGRDRRPAINVSWDDANGYVSWLSAETGADYRLPSEIEWAYAARAGTSTKYSWGDGIGINRANCMGAGPLPEVVGHKEVATSEGTVLAAVFDPEWSDWGLMGTVACYDTWRNTAPVGSFAANGFGLYDMHGNVSEWVDSSGDRATCGGSHADAPVALEARFCRTYRGQPKDGHIDVGFRVAMTLAP